MAAGDIKWFAQALADLMNKIHDLDTDDIRVGLVTNSTVPAVNTAAPHWGGTGATNFASTQVSTGGTSYTGPIALSSESISLGATGPSFRAAVVTVSQDASGPTNIAYGIVFNNSDANKRALGYVEISSTGAASLVTGPLSLDWNGANNDILSLTQS